MMKLSLIRFLSVTSAASIYSRLAFPAVEGYGVTYLGIEDSQYGVEKWLGIRYTNPPVGALRLQPAVPFENKGTVKAQQFGSPCFGLDANHTGQSEDCLFVNVYKPTPHNGQKATGLPVMVWIHGGGFNRGAGSIYNGESLVQRSREVGSPTIVVTINYRLSFFGFSAGQAAKDNDALNLGLRDQREALKWVNKNIHLWGGDCEKVTIFGQSAGATSIGLQITAFGGRTDGLFRAAILESGSPADTSPTPLPTFSTFQQGWDLVVKAIGCSTAVNVFKCVQGAPSEALFTAITNVGLNAPLPDGAFPWEPVVDGHFVQDYPSRLLYNGKFAHIPTITGFTTDEVTYVIPETLNISSEQQILGLFTIVLPFVSEESAAEILTLDPLSASPNPGGVGGPQWKRATNIASDIFERCPGIAFARNMTAHAPGWKYRWNAVLPAQLASDPAEGVVHASEIPYVWGPSITPFINAPGDIALSKVVQKGWLAFASHLDPNALGELAPGLKWPQYHRKTEKVMVFQLTDGTQGPVGQGLHLEKDKDDRPACDFIIAKDLEFVR